MLSEIERQELIVHIRAFPEQLEALVGNLTSEQLTTSYLSGEWTVAQIVHHMADSHLNGYIRMKLIASEDKPLLKTYRQEIWAEMADVYTTPIAESLAILRGVHRRWSTWLENVNDADWQRIGVHPDLGEMTMDAMLQKYVGHGENHINHVHKILAAQPA
jgi:hypothetical protein